MAQQKRNWVAIITMFALFAMVGFVTNMAAPFGNIWGFPYPWAGMFGNLMNFAAYLFMGIPAGNMLIKYGYKKTALIGMLIGIAGLLVQYTSSIFGADIKVGALPEWFANFLNAPQCSGQIVALNLVVYLLGAFICGFSVCILNTVVNPMLNLLGGGGNTGNQLLQIGGSCNSLAGTLTPMLVGVLIGTVTEDTAMTDVTPLLFVGIAVFVIAFVIVSRLKIDEPQSVSNVIYERSALAFRHCLLGVIAIFFYVGIEIGIPAQLNFYVSQCQWMDGVFEGSAAVGGSLAALYWLLMMFGRMGSSAISGKVSTKTQLVVASAAAIVLILIAIMLPETMTMNLYGGNVPVKCVFLFLCGIFTSVMWGGIFNLSTEGLGKYTAKASGLFMTMVVGGGIMPLIQNAIATKNGAIVSYWLIVAMLAYILFYALVGSKNVNKDIKVD